MTQYFCWFDDDKRHSPAQRVQDGIQAYTAKFGSPPNVVLVHRLIDAPIRVEESSLVRVNNYYFAYEPPRYPGANWRELPLYKGGHSCPTHLVIDGVLWAYVDGSGLTGEARYERV